MTQQQQRDARWGQNLYRVITPTETLFLNADSITVRDGVLMLAAEVDDHDDPGTPPAIELPPAAIFAPGQWLSCVMVTWDDHEILFSEAFRNKVMDETIEAIEDSEN